MCPAQRNFVHIHDLVVTQPGKIDNIIFILQIRKLMLREVVT